MDTKTANMAMEQKLDADLALLAQLIAIANEHKKVRVKTAFFECIFPCLSPAKVEEFLKIVKASEPPSGFDR